MTTCEPYALNHLSSHRKRSYTPFPVPTHCQSPFSFPLVLPAHFLGDFPLFLTLMSSLGTQTHTFCLRHDTLIC